MIISDKVFVALDSSIFWSSALISAAIIYNGFIIAKAFRKSKESMI
jgi:hypothetical protein